MSHIGTVQDANGKFVVEIDDESPEVIANTEVRVYGPNGYFTIQLPGVSGDPLEDVKNVQIQYTHDGGNE